MSHVSIILCAGEGSRVGGNKGLLQLGGRPALERLLGVTSRSRVDAALVVTGHQHEAVEEICRACGAASVHNAGWRAGMTSSIRSGVAALPPDCETFLIHPVDHLLTQPEDIDALLDAWERHPQREAAIVRPRHGHHYGHPVLFARRYAGEFLALADDQPGRLVYRSHLDLVTAVEVANPWIRFDLDTPEDLKMLKGSGFFSTE